MKKEHQHTWLTGEVAIIHDPDYEKWFITRWHAFPKDNDDADSCHTKITMEQAEET